MRRLAVVAFALLLASAAWAGQSDAPDPSSRNLVRALEEVFTAIADRVTPAVVNVSTVARKAPAGGREELERFREFFGEDLPEGFSRRRPQEPRASGSGVVVDPAGYILTNNHVIENAHEIAVRLADGRKLTARLVGRDPKTDLAVLKVDARDPLPAARLGNSDVLRVGQWAVAIGSPFGLDRTVTVGIISGTARTRLGVTTYENFIQTDASINPGNSGGPLLNLDGEVIGINTAIVAAGQGIGFSIPINQAREVMRQLITQGRVVRGWLGVVIQDVTEQLSGSFGVGEREGVLVADVVQGAPADGAGVKPGDVIVEFDGVPVREVPELQRHSARVAPGKVVTVVVVRDRARLPVKITIGEMPGDEPIPAADPGEMRWGLRVEPLEGDAARRLTLPFERGAVIAEVAPGGPADRAGLRRGDVILDVKGRPIADPPALYRELDALKPGDAVPIYVHRPGGSGGRNQYLVLERPAGP